MSQTGRTSSIYLETKGLNTGRGHVGLPSVAAFGELPDTSNND